MDIDKLGIVEIDKTSPRLELTPEEVEAPEDELVDYHSEFADRSHRVQQTQWGYKYLQGLMSPIKRKAIQPMARREVAAQTLAIGG
jgi:hypothetical protein